MGKAHARAHEFCGCTNPCTRKRESERVVVKIFSRFRDGRIGAEKFIRGTHTHTRARARAREQIEDARELERRRPELSKGGLPGRNPFPPFAMTSTAAADGRLKGSRTHKESGRRCLFRAAAAAVMIQSGLRAEPCMPNTGGAWGHLLLPNPLLLPQESGEGEAFLQRQSRQFGVTSTGAPSPFLHSGDCAAAAVVATSTGHALKAAVGGSEGHVAAVVAVERASCKSDPPKPLMLRRGPSLLVPRGAAA